MFSDTYKIKLVDDVIYEVYGKVRSICLVSDVSIGSHWTKIPNLWRRNSFISYFFLAGESQGR